MSLTFATLDDIEEGKQTSSLLDLTFKPEENAATDQNYKKIAGGVPGELNKLSLVYRK